MNRYRAASEFLKERYGGKVYRLSLETGCTCPNRDGTLGTGGCIFCNGGSGAFAASGENLEEQLMAAKERIAAKYRGNRYIAYYQSYTNTYGDVRHLESLFMKTVNKEEIVQLSIATRPDCLGDSVLEMLTRLSRMKPISIELGLQTIHPQTARYIRRGYDLEQYDAAVMALKQRNIECVVHMILGLPGETRREMLETAEYISRSGADGIKLQLLHILKGTDLETEYREGRVPVLAMEEYIDLLLDCMEHVSPDLVIHRMTGDGSNALLVAPMWSTDKKKVLNRIHQRMEERDFHQGSHYK